MNKKPEREHHNFYTKKYCNKSARRLSREYLGLDWNWKKLAEEKNEEIKKKNALLIIKKNT